MSVTIRESSFPASCGIGAIYARYWIPEEPRAVVQICHGMAEHISRYDELADRLAGAGYLVCGIDYKGHGRSLREGEPKGYFAAVDGWDYNVKDVMALRDRVAAEWPGLPYVLFGHSMGSFLARTGAGRHGDAFDGFIFSGTAGKNPVLGIALLLAANEIRRTGGKVPCDRINNLAFGSYLKRIPNPRTPYDWISSREDVVDKYAADENCGFTFTAQGFYDMFTGLKEVQAKTWAPSVPDKPILLFAGTEDPVGSYGKGVEQVYDWLKKSGHGKAALKLYPGARHEVHNETCAEELYADLLKWLEENIPAKGAVPRGV